MGESRVVIATAVKIALRNRSGTFHRKQAEGTGARGLGRTAIPERYSPDGLVVLLSGYPDAPAPPAKAGCLSRMSAAQIPTPHDSAMRIEGAQKKRVLVLPAAAGAAAASAAGATTTAAAGPAAAATTSATTTAAAGAAAADGHCPDAVLDHDHTLSLNPTWRQYDSRPPPVLVAR